MEDKKTDLTVAICVYNGEKYVLETLQSLAAQTYKNFSLLIIDDGSTDHTVSIIEKGLKKFNFLSSRIIQLEHNSGQAAARNVALQNVSTKYMTFFDADDVAEPEMLEKMYNRLTADKNVVAVGCFTSMIDSNGNPMPGGIRLGPIEKEDSLSRAKAGKLFFLSSSSAFVVAEVKRIGGYLQKGFPDGKVRYADYCEDCDLWTRLSDLYAEGKYLIVIPEKLYRYRKHEHSSSNDNSAMLLRMKHIKENVKRRRSGRPELTFIEFEQTLTPKERQKIKKEAEASMLVRKAGFALHNRRLLHAVGYMLQASIKSPSYVCDKVNSYRKRSEKKK